MRSFLAFTISHEGSLHPVHFEPQELARFEREHVQNVDRELKHHSELSYGPFYFLNNENHLGVAAALLSKALRENDIQTVEKYVFWIATRFPEITGINITKDTYEFLADEFSKSRPKSSALH